MAAVVLGTVELMAVLVVVLLALIAVPLVLVLVIVLIVVPLVLVVVATMNGSKSYVEKHSRAVATDRALSIR